MAILSKVVNWARRSSPWVLHFNSGSCNGCDIEILAALTPRFDVERFGITLQGSPRHADVLLITGPVTEQVKKRLVRIYNQMPDPKFVIVVGTCGCTGGVFSGSYSTNNGVDNVIPVDVYIPGCPPRPQQIIDAVVKLLAKLSPNKDKNGGTNNGGE
ncbi:MAG: NADH-quinone oxidoreductase subunit B family protein [Candidatus Asgardarchaeia archaeon]